MLVWMSQPTPGLVPVEEGKVSPLDRGLLLGDGLFETMWVCGGRAPLLDWHRERLEEGCRLLGFPVPPWDLAALLAEVTAANGLAGHGFVRVTLTRGSGPRGYAPPPQAEPQLLVQAGPWSPVAPDRALRVGLAPWPLPFHPVLSRVKHTSRLLQVLARIEADRLGLDDLLSRDADGRLAESIASNVFWTRQGVLYTPACETGCLPGVGRRWVMARRDVQTCLEPPATLEEADEVFLTNALTGPVPVRTGLGRAWPAPGPVAKKLQQEWLSLSGGAGFTAEGLS